MNLRNFEINKLENLPSRAKFSDELTTKVTSVRCIKRHNPEGRYRRNGWCRWHNYGYQVATKILKASVGKTLDSIMPRLKEVSPEYYRRVVKDWLTRTIRCEDGIRFLDDYGRVRELITHPTRWWPNYYLNADGVIKRQPIDQTKRRFFNPQKHYSYITTKRQSNKESRRSKEERAIVLQSLLGRPHLLKVYSNIKNQIDMINCYYRQEIRDINHRKYIELKKLEATDKRIREGDLSELIAEHHLQTINSAINKQRQHESRAKSEYTEAKRIKDWETRINEYRVKDDIDLTPTGKFTVIFIERKTKE